MKIDQLKKLLHALNAKADSDRLQYQNLLRLNATYLENTAEFRENAQAVNRNANELKTIFEMAHASKFATESLLKAKEQERRAAALYDQLDNYRNRLKQSAGKKLAAQKLLREAEKNLRDRIDHRDEENRLQTHLIMK